MAKGGELGILEGRTGALIHPAIMFFLFFATGYTGYLGYQWRRVCWPQTRSASPRRLLLAQFVGRRRLALAEKPSAYAIRGGCKSRLNRPVVTVLSLPPTGPRDW